MKAARKYETAFAILCIICASVFFVSASISADISRKEEEQARLIVDTQEAPAAEPTHEAAFTLMEHEGRVYVYSAGAPFMLTDIDPAGLPSADREKLRLGIGAKDREELLGLIEDFGS